MPDGTISYQGAGNFTTDSTGQLVTPNGYPIQPTITIPPQTTYQAAGKLMQVANQMMDVIFDIMR